MNTPKQKAKELIEKFKDYVLYDYDDTPFLDYQKQCALIAVDELIEEAYFTDGYYDRQEYWEEVKKEIENYERAS